ncbi:MAG: DUF6776 family protein [Endozoicomonas sp.]
MFVSILGIIIYWYGGSDADESLDAVRQKNTRLVQQAQALQEENIELKQRLTIMESSGKMDKDAVNNVRLIVRKLEEEKEQLHKELSFFRNILAPEDSSTGVRIADFSLLSGEGTDVYRMRLVVSQVARSNPFLKGTLSLTFEGWQDGKKKVLTIQQLADSDQMTTRLGFRYFQALPADRDYLEFKLPNGFEPSDIKVVIQITSGIKQSFEQVYQWDKELVEDVQQEQRNG